MPCTMPPVFWISSGSVTLSIACAVGLTVDAVYLDRVLAAVAARLSSRLSTPARPRCCPSPSSVHPSTHKPARIFPARCSFPMLPSTLPKSAQPFSSPGLPETPGFTLTICASVMLPSLTGIVSPVSESLTLCPSAPNTPLSGSQKVSVPSPTARRAAICRAATRPRPTARASHLCSCSCSRAEALSTLSPPHSPTAEMTSLRVGDLTAVDRGYQIALMHARALRRGHRPALCLDLRKACYHYAPLCLSVLQRPARRQQAPVQKAGTVSTVASSSDHRPVTIAFFHKGPPG